MNTCGFRWHYDPAYAHPKHPDHICAIPAGQEHQYHECECKCWVNVDFAEGYVKK